MGAQIVGMLDEAGRMFKQLVDEMMKARENIINQVVVESFNEEPTGSYVKIYLRDDGEQSE